MDTNEQRWIQRNRERYRGTEMDTEDTEEQRGLHRNIE